MTKATKQLARHPARATAQASVALPFSSVDGIALRPLSRFFMLIELLCERSSRTNASLSDT